VLVRLGILGFGSPSGFVGGGMGGLVFWDGGCGGHCCAWWDGCKYWVGGYGFYDEVEI